MTQDYQVVGKRVPRLDALSKAVGDLRYVSDLQLPGILVGKVLRSPLPHAKILHIDISKAIRVTGVKAVITAEDTPCKKFCMNPAWANNMLLQNEKVRYVGDQVAAVAAVDEETALEALSLIQVDYEPLPAVFDPEEAMRPGAPQIHREENNIALHSVRNFGDVDKGFEGADYICEGSYSSPPVAHCCMEPRGCVADYERSGRLTVWSTTQTPHPLREELSEVLGLPQSKVSVFQAPVGGAFGARMGMDPIDGIAAILSMKSQRPVKVINTREEEFLSSRIRYPMRIWIKSGARKNGRLIAREIKVITDNGAYNHEGQYIMGNAGSKLAQLYSVPNIRYEGFLVYTNNVYGGAFRGYGNPQITFAMETQLDQIAEALNMDPVEIRLINANQPDSITASGCKITSCGLAECIKTVAENARWRDKKTGKKENTPSHRRGIGLACMIHGGSGVKFFWGKDCNFSSAIIKINTDGSVDLLTGSAELGQGSNTTLAMIAAEELGVSLSDMNVINGDTDTTPPCAGAWGTRQTFTAGNAVRGAASEAKRQLFEIVSGLLEASIQDLEAKDGKIFVKGTSAKYVTVGEAASESWRNRGTPIVAKSVNVDPWCSQPDLKTGYGNVSSAYAFAAQAAEVEVDMETGLVNVIHFWCAHDVGKVINPIGAECQIEGGVISMGVGYALMENLVLQGGGVQNTNFADYKIPTMLDSCGVNTYLIETIDEHGPFGAKGLGEPSMIPTCAAIANAIYDAVGVWVPELPITPEKVLKAIREKQRGKA
jgi:4-hydroxybenzoyl-CoA reductase alpha subunit